MFLLAKTKRTPREYQKEALKAIASSRESGKGLVVMASGLGKTMTVIFDIDRYLKDHPDAKFLYLCDSIPILTQAKDEFKKYFGEEYSYSLFDAKHTPERKVNFLFGAFGKMANSLENFPENEFDYIVVDEAHHAQATTYQKVVLHFQPQYLLGLTATPVRLDQRNIEDLFGAPIFNLGLARALVEGLLTPIDYRIMDDELNAEEIERFVQSSEKISLAQLNKRFFLPLRDEEIVRIIREKIAEFGGKRTVIFCKNIQHAEETARLMPEATVVHSGMEYEESEKRIHDFKKGKIGILIAVDKLNEGVDIPEVDVVVFLRTTTSPTILLQQMGRGLRIVPGKDFVHILDFVANIYRLQDLNHLQKEMEEEIEEGTRTSSRARSLAEAFSISMPSKKFKERQIDFSHIVSKIDSSKRIYMTKEERLAEYKRFYIEHGRFPTQKEMQEEPGLTDAATYIALFGSMANLRKLATGEDVLLRKNFSDNELLSMFRNKALSLKRIPLQKEIDEDPAMPCAFTYFKRFGKLSAISKLAGVDDLPVSEKKARYWTEDEVIESIRKMTEELGRPPYADEMRSPYPSKDTIRKLFGTHSEAVKRAGLDVEYKTYTKEEAVVRIRELTKELGRPPKTEEMTRPTKNVCVRLFGSWENALKEANDGQGLPKRNWTKGESIIRILEVAQELGHTPSQKEMHHPGYAYLKRLFGSYNNAIIAAGLEPNKPYRAK